MTKPDDSPQESAFPPGDGETRALIANYDWSSTPLGPLSEWPQSLKTATAMVLDATLAMAILYGEDAIMIYNDAFAALAGLRHPRALGSKTCESWPETAELTEQVMKIGLAGGTLKVSDIEMTIDRSGRTEKAWGDIDFSPLRDESGRPVGVLTVVTETTKRILAERKATAQAERQRRMFEQAPGFICLLSGPDHVFEFVNDAHKRLFGDRDAAGRPFREVFPEASAGLIEQVWATGERYVARDARVLISKTPGGPQKEYFLDFVVEPVTGDDGELVGIFFEGFDVTERVHAQAAVQESNRRLNAATALARLGTFEWDLETHEALFDDRAREILGLEPQGRVTREDLRRRVHKDDLAVLDSEPIPPERRTHEYRVQLPDGSIRNVVSTTDVLPRLDGGGARLVGVLDDVTERRRAEKHQRLLINELNHRVKNTLATVQSLAAQTLRSAPDLANAREAYEARLMALAVAHDLLTRESWRGARLTDVVASAMAPFETTQRPQISRAGPPIWLTAQRALALSMALHELATNALKHGALSRPDGQVSIRWGLAGGDELMLSWREQGGPPVVFPARTGFGGRMLQRSLARELGGEVALAFNPEGVRCEIRFNLETTRTAPIFDIAGI